MITVDHWVGVDVGNTHASSVMPEVRCSEALCGTVTMPLPLNASAPPKRPCAVRVTPEPRVPVLLLPEASLTATPLVSLNAQAATRPAGAPPGGGGGGGGGGGCAGAAGN